MLIDCLINLLVVAVIAVIVLVIFENVLAAFFNDARIVMLIRALVGLLVLLYAVQCILRLDYLPHAHVGY